MLEKIRTSLRITTDKLDDEITDLIEACKLDLKLAGIGNINEADPLIIRAVTVYAKAHFGFSSDKDRFRRSYDMLKCSLALTKEYTDV